MAARSGQARFEPVKWRCPTACTTLSIITLRLEAHRRPGDVHVHFFGTDCLSFGAGIRLEDGDMIQVAFDGFGRPLRNPLHVQNSGPTLIEVTSLG